MLDKRKQWATKDKKLTKPVKITGKNLSIKNGAILFMEIAIAEWKPDLTATRGIGYEPVVNWQQRSRRTICDFLGLLFADLEHGVLNV